MDFPLRSLVASRLRPIREEAGFLSDKEFTLATFDGAVPHGAEAVAGSGVGLDHFRGERILCSAHLRFTPSRHEHRMALAITDRRTVLGGWSDIKDNFNGKRFSIPHADLVATASEDGLLARSLGLVTATGKFEAPLGSSEGIKALDAFYRGMIGEVPPAARVEPPTPFPAPSADDPAGARAAADALWFEDPRARQMLQALAAKARTGEMEASVAADLVSRVVLAHRSRGGGAGMQDALWISPMSVADFGHTLLRIYGTAQQHGEPHPGVHSADFGFDPKRDPIVTVLDGVDVASYFVLGVGLAPTRLIGGAIAEAIMRKDPIRQLRFVFGERPGFTGYQIHTPGRVLEDHDAQMAHRIHHALGYFAYAVLERRCALGWGPAYADLWR